MIRAITEEVPWTDHIVRVCNPKSSDPSLPFDTHDVIVQGTSFGNRPNHGLDHEVKVQR